MALVIMGTCQLCGAQQLQDGRILLTPESQCNTHDFIHEDADTPDLVIAEKPPIRSTGGGGVLATFPTQKECTANDNLNDHLVKVEGKISQTKATIQTLDDRCEHWRIVIQEDFQQVINAAETRREKLLQDLDTLVQNKQDQLAGQLHQYQDHYNDCQTMLESIFERIQTVKRDPSREQGIVADSAATIRQFPKLNAIPIAVAGECQTQPLVATLSNFGAILESDLGRLPTVLISETNESRQTIKYTVIEPDDTEEKTAVNFIQGLMVEVQATVFGDRSLGWNIAWLNRVPCENIEGSMRIDVKSLPASDKVYIRARTIIIQGKEALDPIRISRWSDVAEMSVKVLPRSDSNRSSIPSHSRSQAAPAAPDKNIFVVCVDPSTGRRLPVRPQPPDYIGAIKNAAIKKFKWNSSPQDITLKVVKKDEPNEVVHDLSAEPNANNLLADVWDRNIHFIHVFEQGGEPRREPSRSPAPFVPPIDPEPVGENIEWPKRLMIRIKEHATRESPARPSPLRIEDRALAGGWLGALQKRYCERFNLEQEGEMQFFFVDDEGNRVKDITRDVDFLYVQEHKRRVYAVGERA